MADKEIYADGILIGAVTKVDVSSDIPSADPIKTFDGNVPGDAPDEIPWKITIEKIRYGKVADFDAMEALLLSMIKTPKDIMVIERSNGIDGKITKKQVFYKSKVSNTKYTIDTENKTADNIELTCTNMTQWNSKGKKIKF